MVGLGPVHLHALHAFARQRVASAELLWIAPSPKSALPGQEAACVAGDIPLAQVSLDLSPVFRAAQATPVHASVTGLDVQQRRLWLSDGQVLSYDALSLDLASFVDRDQIPGARALGLFTRPPEFFLDMVERLTELAQQRPLNVVLIGKGAAAFELAMALSARLQGKSPGASRVVWVTEGEEALPGFSEPMKARAQEWLKAHGVTVLQAHCTAVEAEHVCLDNGARVACDAPILALPPQLPKWLNDSGLTISEDGDLHTLATFQSSSHPAVFACGVGAGLSAVGPADTVSGAAQAGAALAENVRRFIGSGELVAHDPPNRHVPVLNAPGGRTMLMVGTHLWEGRLAQWWMRRMQRRAMQTLRISSSDGR